MAIPEEMMYNQFSQYFVENVDELNGLTAEVEELLSDGETVPKALEKELHRHQVIVTILTQLGREKYQKEAKQIYHDGWNFWFKEDAELREKRYGRKNND